MVALGRGELIDINISIIVLSLEEERAVDEMVGVPCHPHEQHRHSVEGTLVIIQCTCFVDCLFSCLAPYHLALRSH